MSILNKVENAYLTILRLVVLTGATLALVSAIILGASAASKLLGSEPKDTDPVLVTPGNTPKLDTFLATSNPEAEQPKNAESSTTAKDKTTNPDLDAAANNLSKYVQDVFQGNLEVRKSREIFLEKANVLPEKTQDAYFKSANGFSVELLKKIATQKTLVATARAAYQEPENVPGFINVDAALQWHLVQFAAIIDKNNAEIEQKQQEYVLAKAEGMQELYMTAGSFVTFLLVVFLFIIIKIERNLRGISVIKES
ncbi:MAG: hypothetical protein COZ31_01035 [Nitrospirae bacterium CG_4_10_14_3_um_filter_44_29]|nr:MAG: hypothetical protein COZ31_01035 [Nitrospirae bacterium CG_4_10_14_3_um_filter_44_29]